MPTDGELNTRGYKKRMFILASHTSWCTQKKKKFLKRKINVNDFGGLNETHINWVQFKYVLQKALVDLLHTKVPSILNGNFYMHITILFDNVR
jgi:hypothetical protein